MKPVFVAPTRPVSDTLPCLFLAGPIVGAARWQDQAIDYLQSAYGSFAICNPRRDVDRAEDFDDKQYEEQIDWETEHLAKAFRTGCVLFWLAKEHEHDCRRAFAQTTRFELGEHLGTCLLKKGRFVVGIESGFSGERYIRHRFKRQGFEVSYDLKSLCARAIATCTRIRT